jgi:hypothetical protein
MMLRISNPRADTPVAIMMGDLPVLKARLEIVSNLGRVKVARDGSAYIASSRSRWVRSEWMEVVGKPRLNK